MYKYIEPHIPPFTVFCTPESPFAIYVSLFVSLNNCGIFICVYENYNKRKSNKEND